MLPLLYDAPTFDNQDEVRSQDCGEPMGDYQAGPTP